MPSSMLRSLCAVVSVALVIGLGIGLGTSASAPAQASRISPQDVASGTVTVGVNPNQVAVDDSGTYAYVTAFGPKALVRVRLSDFSVDDSLVFPSEANAVAVYDDTVYVTDMTHFYRVNADTMAPPAADDSVALPAPGGWIAIAWPYGYVTDATLNRVYKIDLRTMVVSAFVSSGGSYATGIAIDPSQQFAYVVNTITSNLTKIRLSDFTSVGSTPVGSGPYEVAIDPTGTYAYVPNAAAESCPCTPPWLSRINLATFLTDDTVLLPFTWGYGVAVNPAGTTAYVTESRGLPRVAKINLGASMTIDDTLITVDGSANSIAVNPTQLHFYTTGKGSPGTLTQVTIAALPVLNASPTSLSVEVGATGTVTISSAALAIPNGTSVSAVSATPGVATVTSTVSSSVGSASFTVTGVSAGTSNVTFSATGYANVVVPVTVTTPTPGPGPAPAPAFPPSAPSLVTGVAGDGSAVVSWAEPSSAGSFPVSTYQAVVSPGGQSCLVQMPALTCTIAKLSNGTAYTATVRALNGAGWGAYSNASPAFTPSQQATPSILLTGSRGDVRGKPGAIVTGVAARFSEGAILRPWMRFPGQTSFSQGTARILVEDQGAFMWQRRTSTKISIVIKSADGKMQSNRVTIDQG